MTVRALTASALTSFAVTEPLHWLADRFFGGFVLAFHTLPVDRFCTLVDAMKPREVVHLDELVDRVKSQKATDGLFAVTVDDGEGETVRGLSAAAIARQWPITFYLPTRYLETGHGMPFQWLDKLLPVLPPERLSAGSIEIDASTPYGRKEFDSLMRRLMRTRPAYEYLSVIEDLVAQALRRGWATHAQLATPSPIQWDEVATLARQPAIRFESHGVSHTAVSALHPDRLAGELIESRRLISENTNRRCRHFCYPFGGEESIGERAPRIVAQYFDSAVTMSRGRLRGHDAMLLPRIPFYSGDTPAVAQLKLLTWR
jgi:peptidoglycan/xylan/chitin deacetylase (PgdA/CDA1 family)